MGLRHFQYTRIARAEPISSDAADERLNGLRSFMRSPIVMSVGLRWGNFSSAG